jgi:NHL repeat-containing protein
MTPFRGSEIIAGGARTGILVVLAVCVGAATAQAALLSQVSSFGSQGSGAGQFQAPVGVAVRQSNGAVYVADSGNARVQKFDANGNFVAAFGWGVADGVAKSEICTSSCQAGIPGSGAGQFSLPTSIAVSDASGPSAGKVFVGDAGNNVVLKFDANGNFLSAIDGTTTPQGHFQALVGVAVDQNGALWTLDASTSNITQFDAKGNFVQQWNDTHGSASAIAVDSAHNAVYLITQSTTERWTLTGSYQGQVDRPVFFGSEGFSGPSASALALDRGTGNLYVDHDTGSPSADVTVYDPTAIQLDDVPLGATSNSQGLAFAALQGGPKKPGQQRLYLSDMSANNVTIFAPQTGAGKPLVTSESVPVTGTTTATLAAGVVPLGNDTSCTFQYVVDETFRDSGYDAATSVACTPGDLGSTFAYQAASASISGLTLGAVYHFRVVATNSAGTTTGEDQEFQAGPGAWASFFRCPVDDPAMLATDGVTSVEFCLGSNSTHGSITIGNLTATTGNTNLQTGLVGPDASQLSVISPSSPIGALLADPVEITGTPVGSVTALTKSAGTPSDFNLFAGISTGVPIITLPIKIQLVNPALGPHCFIGSDADPIVLHPQNNDLSSAKSIGGFFSFDPTGVPDLAGVDASLLITGAIQGDDTFAVPGAQGCGPNGSLDAVVNAVVGLPSPAGNNHIVLEDASNGLAFAASVLTGQGARDGQQFSGDWHVGFGQ